MIYIYILCIYYINIYVYCVYIYNIIIIDMQSPTLKMYEGGGTRDFFIHFQAPTQSETGIFVCFFFVKLRGYLKRWGVVLIHFQYLASKACLEKGGEAVSNTSCCFQIILQLSLES